MNLGALLKAARKRRGLSQEELAEKLHRARSCISKYENESKVIDVPTFVQWMKHTSSQDFLIAGLMGVDPTVAMEGLRVISQLMGG